MRLPDTPKAFNLPEISIPVADVNFIVVPGSILRIPADAIVVVAVIVLVTVASHVSVVVMLPPRYPIEFLFPEPFPVMVKPVSPVSRVFASAPKA